MASYIGMGGSISPSRRLTDFLSAYLDFDDGPSSPSASSAAPPPPSSADASFDASANTAGAADNNNTGGGKRRRSLLNLGLWGGDLSLHNVSLKSEAVEPLLNGLLPPPRGGEKRPRPPPSPSSAPDVDVNLEGSAGVGSVPPATGDLQLTLIRGTIGHLRLAVPWRQLVLGGGYDAKEQAKGRGQCPVVEVVVEDVTVVLGLRSSSGGSGGGKGGPSVDANTEEGKLSDNDDEEEEAEERHNRRRRMREERQRRLAESERLHLRGLSIPDGEDHAAWGRDEEGRPLRLDSTAGTGDDAGGGAAAVSSAKGDDSSEQPQPSSTTGMIHRLLQTAASSLVWRLVTHLKVRVRNLRVVIIVDGVEVGLTVDSHDVEYWSEEESGEDEGGEDGATTRGSTPPAVPSVVIRGPPGRIVRRRVPPTNANDASTAPLTVEDSATELPTPVAGGGGGGGSTSSGTNISSSEALGKIVKIRGLGVYVRPMTASTVRLMKQQQRWRRGRGGLRAATVVPPLPRPFPDDYLLQPTMADVTVKLLRNAVVASAGASEQEDGTASATATTADVHLVQPTHATNGREPPPKKRRGKRQKTQSHRPLSSESPQQKTPARTTTTHAVDVVPGADAEFTFVGPIDGGRTGGGVHRNSSSVAGGGSATISLAPSSAVLSGRQPSSSSRTPQLVVGVHVGQIRSVCSTRQHALLHSFANGAARIRNGRPDDTIRSHLPSRPAGPSSGVGGGVGEGHHRAGALPPRGAGAGSGRDVGSSPAARSAVVRAWWRYAYANVGRGVKRRRAMGDMFKAGPSPFDWDAQSRMREEYIAVYTILRLGRRALAAFSGDDDDAGGGGGTTEHGHIAHPGDGAEELLKIEDRLPIEQILLYRSIARSAKIGGTSRVGFRGSSGIVETIGTRSLTSIARPHRLGLIERRKTCAPALATPRAGIGGSVHAPASSLKDYRIESTPSRQRRRHRCSHTSLDLSGSSTLSNLNASDNDASSSRRSSGFDEGDDVGRRDDETLAASLSRPSLHRSLSDGRLTSSLVASQRHNTRSATELAAVLEDVPFEELVQEGHSVQTGPPRLAGEMRESPIVDGDDETDASWRRISEAVDARAAAEDDIAKDASSDAALEFSLRFRFEGFSFALCSQVSAAGGISARSSVDHSWGGDSKDDVSVLTGYSSEGDDIISSASFDPTDGLDRFAANGLLSINGRLHRVVLSGGLDDFRLTVNGSSGGRKHCSFTLGSVNLSSQDSPEPLLFCDALHSEERSTEGTEDTMIERPDDPSQFARGTLVVKYITNDSGGRLQVIEECRARFARLHVFLHPLAFADLSEFVLSPRGQLPVRGFDSHPYEEEYNKLVAMTGSDEMPSVQQMNFSLSFHGVSISVPLISGRFAVGQDLPLALFEVNGARIESISPSPIGNGDPSQGQQRSGSLLNPEKIIGGLSSSTGFRHLVRK